MTLTFPTKRIVSPKGKVFKIHKKNSTSNWLRVGWFKFHRGVYRINNVDKHGSRYYKFIIKRRPKKVTKHTDNML